MCLYKMHRLCVNTLLNVGIYIYIVGEDVLSALIREMGKYFFLKTGSDYRRYIIS